MLVYVGTYSTRGSKGIYAYRFDPNKGYLSPLDATGGVQNPSFLAVHPNRRFLYAVGEVGSGVVAAFAIDGASGKLTPRGTPQSTEGGGPCFVTVDHAGKNVLIANYGGGTVSVLPVASDGTLRPSTSHIQHTGPSHADPKRQEAPHAHSIHVDAKDRFAIAADLGLDKLLVYRYDVGAGTLTPNQPPFTATKPASGPRQFAWHPGGKFAYVANELDSTVAVYQWDEKAGKLTPIQVVSSLPPGYDGTSYPAEVQVHPNGKWVYFSNRGHDSIAVFAVDKATGKLKAKGYPSCGGKTPRHFGIDPAGKFLIAAGQNSDNLVVFKIDGRTGNLSPTGIKVDVPSPVCVVFVPGT